MQLHQPFVDLIAPVVEMLGYDFEGLELLTQGRFSTLRVFIDKSSGINSEDCQKVSAELSAVLGLDEELNQYDLEVSSPGLDRLLFNVKQMQNYIGRELKLKMRIPFEGRKSLNVKLVDVLDDEHVRVALVNDKVVISLANIDQARLVPKW